MLLKILKNKEFSKDCFYMSGLKDLGKDHVNYGDEELWGDITFAHGVQGQLNEGTGVSSSQREAAWRGPLTQKWGRV